MNDYGNKILKTFLEDTKELSKEQKIRILDARINHYSDRELFDIALILKREQDRLKMKGFEAVFYFFE